MIRIVIADDHKLFRDTLSDVLQSNPGFRVIAGCGNSEEVIETVRKEDPDIVLMDINMHPISGIETTEKITGFSKAGIIGLSMHAHPSYAKKMMRAGASGYITKNSSSEEIFTAIAEVTKKNKYLCKETKTIISDELLDDHAGKPSLAMLTEREIEVVHFIREGYSSKEIAGTICLSLKTVEVHRYNILKKLRLKNASSLVNFLYSNAGNTFLTGR
jgi:DNA-binding NarL/FixJ family response regulator